MRREGEEQKRNHAARFVVAPGLQEEDEDPKSPGIENYQDCWKNPPGTVVTLVATVPKRATTWFAPWIVAGQGKF